MESIKLTTISTVPSSSRSATIGPERGTSEIILSPYSFSQISSILIHLKRLRVYMDTYLHIKLLMEFFIQIIESTKNLRVLWIYIIYLLMF